MLGLTLMLPSRCKCGGEGAQPSSPPPPRTPLHPAGAAPPDPLHSGGQRPPDNPKGGARLLPRLNTREFLDPGCDVQDSAALLVAIQMDAWVHGIQDPGRFFLHE